MVFNEEKDANIWKPPTIDREEVEEVKKYSSPAHQVRHMGQIQCIRKNAVNLLEVGHWFASALLGMDGMVDMFRLVTRM